MFKKIIIGILALTVISATGAAAAYNIGKDQDAPVLSSDGIYTAQDVGTSNRAGTPHDARPQLEDQNVIDMIGEPFSALAQIRGFDPNGINVVFESGETAYIELGPEEYWRGQGIQLSETDIVTIEGFANQEIYHATRVITHDGNILVLRDDAGQPMWSGGLQQQAAGEHDSGGMIAGQILPENWVSYTGTLTAIANGRMTMKLEDGTSLSFRTGQPRFFRSQGVEFKLGEQIEVVGFYQDTNFTVGDVVQLSTGVRVMLLDPNGRPLWAGPGNSTGTPSTGSPNH